MNIFLIIGSRTSTNKRFVRK